MKEIIMFTTASSAEQLRNQLNKSHQLFKQYNNIIDRFNNGEHYETESGVIYSVIV